MTNPILPSKRPFSILVVDDEATSRLLMGAALGRSGFQASLAPNGADALRQFRIHHYEMVMLDVEMPGMDGYQVCTTLRSEAGDDLPIVMVTGRDNLDSIERAYKAGATDFMAKPINWSLLGHRVKYLFRSYLARLELHAANVRLSAILDAIPDPMFELDLSGRYLDHHFPRNDLPPMPSEDIIGRTVHQVLPPEAAEVHMSALLEANEKGFSTGKQFKRQLPQGVRWFELSVARKSTDFGSEQNFIILSHDITERKLAMQKIVRLAYFDSLTGLPNRVSFLERLERSITQAHCHCVRLAILFLDLDRFKNINDTLGHASGNLVLQQVADRLRRGMRSMDAASQDADQTELDLARLGGDEFSVMMRNIADDDDAMRIANHIRELIRQPFNLAGHDLVLTASIGIAVYPENGESAEILLKYADTAMYHAKNKGRDNCQFYDASLTRQAMRRLNLESSLRLALERDEFFLLYQPQIDLGSGRIASVEALIRWKHPEQGVVSPIEFIPLAEETGLIVPIGEWAIRTACATTARWHAAGHFLRVAVNLSPVQFRNPNLLDSVNDILAMGLAPEWLELEVTESALMENSDMAVTTLRNFRKRGVQISLDDFGTGYSSMSYLTRLPLNTIKVDQSFVSGLPDDRDSLMIVRTIISMAKNLGFTVTAEGVETLAQAQILHQMSCDTLQGYYFSRPVDGGAIPALLGKRWSFDTVRRGDDSKIAGAP